MLCDRDWIVAVKALSWKKTALNNLPMASYAATKLERPTRRGVPSHQAAVRRPMGGTPGLVASRHADFRASYRNRLTRTQLLESLSSAWHAMSSRFATHNHGQLGSTPTERGRRPPEGKARSPRLGFGRGSISLAMTMALELASGVVRRAQLAPEIEPPHSEAEHCFSSESELWARVCGRAFIDSYHAEQLHT